MSMKPLITQTQERREELVRKIEVANSRISDILQLFPTLRNIREQARPFVIFRNGAVILYDAKNNKILDPLGVSRSVTSRSLINSTIVKIEAFRDRYYFYEWPSDSLSDGEKQAAKNIAKFEHDLVDLNHQLSLIDDQIKNSQLALLIATGHLEDLAIPSRKTPEEKGKNTDNQSDPSSDAFKHSPDYRSVNNKGTVYSLTAQQAQVIKALHEALLNGTPTLSEAYIIANVIETEGYSKRLKDSFRVPKEKDLPDAWHDLIKQGPRKGTYMLNI